MKFRIMKHELRIMVKMMVFIAFLMIHNSLFIIPVYAEVDIGKEFGFGEIGSFGEGVSKLVTPGFSVASVLVIIYFLFGAFKFLSSGGDKEKIAEGRQMITHSMIGFIILMFAFVILQFLLSSLFGITGFLII